MRTRSYLLTFTVVAIVAALGGSVPVAGAEGRSDDLARARVLDHEGVRAYREGRYKDAIRYFSEALKLGAPPSELWNIAKCNLRLDEPEQAAGEIQKYLAQSGLSPEDRAEAAEQLQQLQKRRSTLTVSSVPSGATLSVDGRKEPSATTPLSVEIAPGAHAITVEAPGYRPSTTQVEARFGRAVIMDAELVRGEGAAPPVQNQKEKPGRGEQPVAAPEPEGARRIDVGAQVGAFLPRLGGYAESAHAGFSLAATYYVYARASVMIGVGGRFFVTGDAWSNTIAAPTGAINCGAALSLDQSGTEVSGFGTGTFAYRITPRFGVGADLGLGVASYSASEVGGDLFVPSCQPSFGVRPALHVGTELSYSLAPFFRIVAAPAMLEVHPAFDGVRHVPIDASGLWLRLGAGIGLAVDL